MWWGWPSPIQCKRQRQSGREKHRSNMSKTETVEPHLMAGLYVVYHFICLYGGDWMLFTMLFTMLVLKNIPVLVKHLFNCIAIDSVCLLSHLSDRLFSFSAHHMTSPLELSTCPTSPSPLLWPLFSPSFLSLMFLSMLSYFNTQRFTGCLRAVGVSAWPQPHALLPHACRLSALEAACAAVVCQ